MKVTKLNCTACGAPISVPDDIDFINCASCGSFLGVERGEGYVALKVAEKIARAIEDSGKGTQDVVRENTLVTRSELQRLQIAQEISSTQMQLANIQAEIRGLLRGPSNNSLKSQLYELRGNEFNLMDRVRILNEKSAALGPQDSVTRIKNIESQISWLDAESQVLTQTNFPNRYLVAKQFADHKKQLLGQVVSLKAQDLKKQFKSFQVLDLPLTNLEQAASLLGIMAAEEAILRKKYTSPEHLSVLQDLTKRKNELYKAYAEMENQRIGRLAKYRFSTQNIGNLNSRAEIDRYLSEINQDLAMLAQQPANEVTSRVRASLLDHQNALMRRMKALEREEAAQVRGLTQSSPTLSAGCITAPLLAIGAFFAGLLASTSAPAKQQTVSHAVSFPEGETTQDAAPLPSRSSFNGKAISIGCVLAFASLLGSGFVGLLLFGLTTSNIASLSEGAQVSVVFFFLTAGFALGTYLLIHNIAPNTVIKGLARIPDLRFGKKLDERESIKRNTIRILMGIATCVLIYLFTISLSMSVSDPQGTASVWVFLLGLVIGPIVGVITGKRTDLEGPVTHE